MRILLLALAAGAFCGWDSLRPARAAAQLAVPGRAEWVDFLGRSHPVRHARVQLIDEASGLQIGPSTTTDGAGRYELVVPALPQPADVWVQVQSWSSAADLRDATVDQPYYLISPTLHAAAGSVRLPDVEVRGRPTQYANHAFSVLAALEYGREYVLQATGIEMPRLAVNFQAVATVYDEHELPASASEGAQDCRPATVAGDPVRRTCRLDVVFEDRWDWDVVLHEYGHFVSKAFGFDHNPQAEHDPGRSLAVTLGKRLGIEVAWAEGWATWFAIAAQANDAVRGEQFPGAGDSTYVDTDDVRLVLPLYSQSEYPSRGEDNEGTVARVLYDLADGADANGYDAVAMGDREVWTLLRQGTQPPQTLWAVWGRFANRAWPERARMARIFAEHRAAPLLQSPLDDESLQGSPPLFTWKANGGGMPHDRFTVEFLDPNGVLIDSAQVQEPSYRPTGEVWARIRASGSPVYWTVEGRNTSMPVTGPYMGTVHRLRQ